MGETGQAKRQQEGGRKESRDMGTSGERGKDMGKQVCGAERDDGGCQACTQWGMQHGETKSGKGTRTEEGDRRSGESSKRTGCYATLQRLYMVCTHVCNKIMHYICVTAIRNRIITNRYKHV